MKIVIFGLSISSAWGNGHATLLRGLFRALNKRGHRIHFFERDVPYYAAHRDAESLPFAHLHFYSDWQVNLELAKRELSDADAGIVTSYCPDGPDAAHLVLSSDLPRTVFYDMDTPVTLGRLARGESVEYLPPEGLAQFDLVLSYTGGAALDQLREKLGARCVSALYGCVDPENHHHVDPSLQFAADLSYLGTYSADRQAALENLLISPARLLPERNFLIAGAMYPSPESWPANIKYFGHVSPPEHSAFYSSSPLTLNITRASMAAMGYCPSGRLFEAAACGTAVLSDWWTGLDLFFRPGEEILIATSTQDAVSAIAKQTAMLRRIGARARERALDCHTAEIRAQQLIDLLEAPSDQREDMQAAVCLSESA
ncbi:MAG: glycosyltransferase [Acidobacteriaceae bacterium]|nr:glycosyltransferase [Acidobacteriaceae bacterium]MBV9780762.1 glycosyltransferase [Acidobacteriaceae bacterium]